LALLVTASENASAIYGSKAWGILSPKLFPIFSISLQGSTTPEVYAIDRLSELFTLTFATTSSLPFHFCVTLKFSPSNPSLSLQSLSYTLYSTYSTILALEIVKCTVDTVHKKKQAYSCRFFKIVD